MKVVTAEEDTEESGLARAWLRLRTHPWTALLAVGLASRAVMVLVAVLAGSYFPHEGWDRGPGFVRYFARWDSGFYMDIAELGYGFKPEAWAFNPGYPLAIAAVHALLPVDLPTAGFLVSNAAFLASLVLLYELTRRLFDDAMAWRAGVLLAFFPGTFYLSAIYADALFLALLLGFFLALHQERWLTAGLLVGLASVTRPPGLFLLGSLGLAMLLVLARRRRLPLRAWLAAPLAAIPSGLFLLYCWRATGDPWISPHMREVHWPNVQWHNPYTLRDFTGVPWAIEVLVFGGLALVALACAWSLWDAARLRRVAALPVYAFALVMAVVYFAYSEPNPIVRYLLSFLPAVWMLADLTERPTVFAVVVGGCAAVASLVAAIFATWGPLY